MKKHKIILILSIVSFIFAMAGCFIKIYATQSYVNEAVNILSIIVFFGFGSIALGLFITYEIIVLRKIYRENKTASFWKKYEKSFKKSLNEKCLQVIEEYKRLNQKPCYALNAVDGEPSVLDSKLGGMPYLPIGESLPLDSNGDPMPLFIQMNLSGISLEGYPDRGILQVFVYDEDGSEYEIRYYATIGDYQTKFALPESIWVEEPIKLSAEKAVSYLPPLSDSKGEKILTELYEKITGKIYNENNGTQNGQFMRICEEIYDSIPKANFGGYSDTEQDNNFDYENNAVLFKVHSEVDLQGRVCIGDAGILWVGINKENLKGENFEKAFVGCDWG